MLISFAVPSLWVLSFRSCLQCSGGTPKCLHTSHRSGWQQIKTWTNISASLRQNDLQLTRIRFECQSACIKCTICILIFVTNARFCHNATDCSVSVSFTITIEQFRWRRESQTKQSSVKLIIFFLFHFQCKKFAKTTRTCTLIAFLELKKSSEKKTSLERDEHTQKEMDSCIFLNCKCQLLFHKSNGAIIIVRQFVFTEWIVQAKLKHVLRNSQQIWNAIHNWEIQHERGIANENHRKTVKFACSLVCRYLARCTSFPSCFLTERREKKEMNWREK